MFRALAAVWRWYDQLNERIWEFQMRVMERLYWSIVLRLFPELRRVRDEGERWGVLFAASAVLNQAMPPWQRRVYIAFFLFIAPIGGMGVGWYLAYRLGLRQDYQMLVAFVAGMIAYFAFGLGMTWIQLARLRRFYYTMLRFAGHVVCPECGYDLRGHRAVGPDCICPECGHALEELQDSEPA